VSAVELIVGSIWGAVILGILVTLARIRRRHGGTALSTSRRSPMWLAVLGVATLTNFVVFCYIADRHGGDAWNGYRRGGRYFLGPKGPFYVPVSRDIWMYSYWHELVVWVSFILVFIALAWHLIRSRTLKT